MADEQGAAAGSPIRRYEDEKPMIAIDPKCRQSVAAAGDCFVSVPLRFNSIALAVWDLPAMVRWYENMLGMTCVHRGRFDAVDADFVLLSGSGCTIELISRKADSPVAADRTPPPHHLEHLGWKALVLETEDLAGFSGGLAGAQVEILWDGMRIGDGKHSTMVRDPEGNLIHVLKINVPPL